jgi:hypothetical protein
MSATNKLRERFLAKVDMSVPEACWPWTAAKTSCGYGKIGVAGRTRPAHRVSYELFVGPIPEGLTLDHLCRNPACVNPEHLEPVTQRENTRRGVSPAAHNARKTHCSRGHELQGDNCYVDAVGKRHCRTCRAATAAKPEWRAYRKEYLKTYTRPRKAGEHGAQ